MGAKARCCIVEVCRDRIEQTRIRAMNELTGSEGNLLLLQLDVSLAKSKETQRYLLPLGQMQHKGEPIDLSAIKKTFLLTVEGERDDICAVGQTLAAQDLCSGLKLQRQAVGDAGLSGAAQPHPIEPVTA